MRGVWLGFPLTRNHPSVVDACAPVGVASGAGGGRLAGRQWSAEVDLQALVVLRFFSSPPLLSLSATPVCAGVCRRPPADGRPSEVGGGEPQRGRAPGAAPDPRAVVDSHDATEGARCSYGRILGRRCRGSGWWSADVGEERRGTTLLYHSRKGGVYTCPWFLGFKPN
jgi:hypothetical protein